MINASTPAALLQRPGEPDDKSEATLWEASGEIYGIAFLFTDGKVTGISIGPNGE